MGLEKTSPVANGSLMNTGSVPVVQSGSAWRHHVFDEVGSWKLLQSKVLIRIVLRVGKLERNFRKVREMELETLPCSCVLFFSFPPFLFFSFSLFPFFPFSLILLFSYSLFPFFSFSLFLFLFFSFSLFLFFSFSLFLFFSFSPFSLFLF